VVTASKGCHGIQLLADQDNPDVGFTLSTWDSVEDFNVYRTPSSGADISIGNY